MLEYLEDPEAFMEKMGPVAAAAPAAEEAAAPAAGMLAYDLVFVKSLTNLLFLIKF